jgi:flagellar motor switch protein FliN/FliY
MNAAAADIFARGFLTGFFDVVSALTGNPAKVSPDAPAPLSGFEFEKWAVGCDLTLRGAIADGGAIAVLMARNGGAAVFAAALGDDNARWEQVRQADAASLREVFEPCMGGGVSHFKEKYGKVIPIKSVEVEAGESSASGADLLSILGVNAVAVGFSFDVAPLTGERGVLLFSARFEDIIPSDIVASTAPETGGNGVGESLGPEDAEGILKDNSAGLDVEPAGKAAKRPERASNESLTKNLDMVLDIRLVATARLGRVEMPIHEILALGPGSIIEVGHLVDEPVELLVNDKLIARGDVVVVDEKFGLRITEIISPRERIESLR